MKHQKNPLIFLFIMILSISFSLPWAVTAAEPKKVAILPFAMHSDKDLNFLREGIMDMLASRLAWKGEVEVMEKTLVMKEMGEVQGDLTKEKAVQVGKALGVEYVIMGSLTVFGESVSLDARILNVAQSEELITAYSETKGMDEVIPTVNSFAQDINEKIMGRVAARQAAQTPSVPAGPTSPGGLMAVGESFEGKALGHVQSFRIGINGLAVGDVDGDGKNELVMIDDTTTYVYKWEGKGLIRFRAIKGPWTPSYVWVSVADLDKNGKAEIYLSNPASQTMASEVLEWDGRDFKPIISKQPWFLRVVDIPGEGKKVLGQKRVPNGGYRRGVYVLKRQGDRFVSEKRLALPKFANVHNFVLGDLSGGGGEALTVLLTSYDYLTVFSPGGAMQWKSDDYYGGALTYVEDKVDTTDRDVDTGAYHFLPSPIYLTDVDRDGKKEVMICQNYSRTRRLFSHLREFASGKLHFLDWDEVGLTEKYTTRKMTGPIVAYQVADLDNDGLDELVIASLTKEAIAVVQKPRSKLVVYDLE